MFLKNVKSSHFCFKSKKMLSVYTLFIPSKHRALPINKFSNRKTRFSSNIQVNKNIKTFSNNTLIYKNSNLVCKLTHNKAKQQTCHAFEKQEDGFFNDSKARESFFKKPPFAAAVISKKTNKEFNKNISQILRLLVTNTNLKTDLSNAGALKQPTKEIENLKGRFIEPYNKALSVTRVQGETFAQEHKEKVKINKKKAGYTPITDSLGNGTYNQSLYSKKASKNLLTINTQKYYLVQKILFQSLFFSVSGNKVVSSFNEPNVFSHDHFLDQKVSRFSYSSDYQPQKKYRLENQVNNATPGILSPLVSEMQKRLRLTKQQQQQQQQKQQQQQQQQSDFNYSFFDYLSYYYLPPFVFRAQLEKQGGEDQNKILDKYLKKLKYQPFPPSSIISEEGRLDQRKQNMFHLIATMFDNKKKYSELDRTNILATNSFLPHSAPDGRTKNYVFCHNKIQKTFLSYWLLPFMGFFSFLSPPFSPPLRGARPAEQGGGGEALLVRNNLQLGSLRESYSFSDQISTNSSIVNIIRDYGWPRSLGLSTELSFSSPSVNKASFVNSDKSLKRDNRELLLAPEGSKNENQRLQDLQNEHSFKKRTKFEKNSRKAYKTNRNHYIYRPFQNKPSFAIKLTKQTADLRDDSSFFTSRALDLETSSSLVLTQNPLINATRDFDLQPSRKRGGGEVVALDTKPCSPKKKAAKKKESPITNYKEVSLLLDNIVQRVNWRLLKMNLMSLDKKETFIASDSVIGNNSFQLFLNKSFLPSNQYKSSFNAALKLSLVPRTPLPPPIFLGTGIPSKLKLQRSVNKTEVRDKKESLGFSRKKLTGNSRAFQDLFDSTFNMLFTTPASTVQGVLNKIPKRDFEHFVRKNQNNNDKANLTIINQLNKNKGFLKMKNPLITGSFFPIDATSLSSRTNLLGGLIPPPIKVEGRDFVNGNREYFWKNTTMNFTRSNFDILSYTIAPNQNQYINYIKYLRFHMNKIVQVCCSKYNSNLRHAFNNYLPPLNPQRGISPWEAASPPPSGEEAGISVFRATSPKKQGAATLKQGYKEDQIKTKYKRSSNIKLKIRKLNVNTKNIKGFYTQKSMPIILQHKKFRFLTKLRFSSPVTRLPKGMFQFGKKRFFTTPEITYLETKQKLQKKGKAKKQRLEKRQLKKRKRFYPRPNWLRLRLGLSFAKSNGFIKIAQPSNLENKWQKSAGMSLTPVTELGLNSKIKMALVKYGKSYNTLNNFIESLCKTATKNQKIDNKQRDNTYLISDSLGRGFPRAWGPALNSMIMKSKGLNNKLTPKNLPSRNLKKAFILNRLDVQQEQNVTNHNKLVYNLWLSSKKLTRPSLGPKGGQGKEASSPFRLSIANYTYKNHFFNTQIDQIFTQVAIKNNGSYAIRELKKPNQPVKKETNTDSLRDFWVWLYNLTSTNQFNKKILLNNILNNLSIPIKMESTYSLSRGKVKSLALQASNTAEKSPAPLTGNSSAGDLDTKVKRNLGLLARASTRNKSGQRKNKALFLSRYKPIATNADNKSLKRISWSLHKTNLWASTTKRTNTWSTSKLRYQSKNNKTKYIEKQIKKSIHRILFPTISFNKYFGNKKLISIFSENKKSFLTKEPSKLWKLSLSQKMHQKEQKLGYLIKSTSFVNNVSNINSRITTPKRRTPFLNRRGNTNGLTSKPSSLWWSTLSEPINLIEKKESYSKIIHQPGNMNFKNSRISENNGSINTKRITKTNLFLPSLMNSVFDLKPQINQKKDNYYQTVAALLFHFCALISLISISQIRCFIKFHILMLHKLTNLYFKIIYTNLKLMKELVKEQSGLLGKQSFPNRTTTNFKILLIASLENRGINSILTNRKNKQKYANLTSSYSNYDPYSSLRVLFESNLLSSFGYLSSTKPLSCEQNERKIKFKKQSLVSRTWRGVPPKWYVTSFSTFFVKILEYHRLKKSYFYLPPTGEGASEPPLGGSKKGEKIKVSTTSLGERTSHTKKLVPTYVGLEKASSLFKQKIFINTFSKQLVLSELSKKTINSVKKTSFNTAFQLIYTFEYFLRLIYGVFEKPGDLTMNFVAYAFLLEWSSDLMTLTAENTEKTNWLAFSKLARQAKVSIFPFFFFGNQFMQGLLGTSILNLAFGQLLYKRFLYMNDLLVDIMYQPDTDLINRQKKGTLFWDIWSDVLIKAADKYNINLSSLSNIKEEQNLLIDRFLSDNTLFTIANNQSQSHSWGGSASSPIAFGMQPRAKGPLHPYSELAFSEQISDKAKSSSAHNHMLKTLFNLKTNGKKADSCSQTSGKPIPFSCVSPTGVGFQGGSQPSRQTQDVNQYVTYQSKETDLFLDYHPPKSFNHISTIQYYNMVQQPIGTLVCQIYSGILNKQIAKNILVIGSSAATNTSSSSFESRGDERIQKTLLIQALAGETEIKMITDNASRYAVVNRGFALGIKLLKDVFDSIALNTPCLFLLEDIHLIGERRPLLISDHGDSLGDETNKGIETAFGAQRNGDASHEKNQVLYQLSRHGITHYKKPFKGDSLSIPTNHFCFDLFLKSRYASFVSTPTNPLAYGITSNTFSKGSTQNMGSGDLAQKNQSNTIFEKIISKRRLIKNTTASNNTNKVLSSFLQLNSLQNLLLSPPATSPFTVQLLKDQKKFKAQKIVSELPWVGVPSEQLSLLPRASYSVLAKVSALAELGFSNMSAKLDMITDLLVIIDSVRGNRGFVVFATTHLPHILDPALRRPGRLDETISIPTLSNLWNRWEFTKASQPMCDGFFSKQSSSGLENIIPDNITLPSNKKLPRIFKKERALGTTKQTSMQLRKVLPFSYQASNTILGYHGTLDYLDFVNFDIIPNQNVNIVSPILLSALSKKNKFFVSHKALFCPPLVSPCFSGEVAQKTKGLLLPPTGEEKGSWGNKGETLKVNKAKEGLGKPSFLRNKKYMTLSHIAYYQMGKKLIINFSGYLGNPPQKTLPLVLQQENLREPLEKQNKASSSAFLLNNNPIYNNSKTYDSTTLVTENKGFILNEVQYKSLYASPKIIQNTLVGLISGKLSELFAFKTLPIKKTKDAILPLTSFLSVPSTSTNTLIKQNFISLYGIDQTWRAATTLALSFVKKRYLYNSNLIVPKLLHFLDFSILEEPPSPPSSNILIPAKRYENYKKAFQENIEKKARSFLIQDKLAAHTKQSYIKSINSNKKNQRNKIMELANFERNQNLSRQSSSVNWYYQNQILKRHRNYLTNQWWNGQLTEHSSESLFLSDIDWRYTINTVENPEATKTNLSSLVSDTILMSGAIKKSQLFFAKLQNQNILKVRHLQVEDILIDFPDSDQHYNPKHRRWMLNSGYWSSFTDIIGGSGVAPSIPGKNKNNDIFDHLIMESFMDSYNLLDKNRELLDYSVAKFIKTGLIKEKHLISFTKKFDI